VKAIVRVAHAWLPKFTRALEMKVSQMPNTEKLQKVEGKGEGRGGETRPISLGSRGFPNGHGG
jgi:hypothetical protein